MPRKELTGRCRDDTKAETLAPTVTVGTRTLLRAREERIRLHAIFGIPDPALGEPGVVDPQTPLWDLY